MMSPPPPPTLPFPPMLVLTDSLLRSESVVVKVANGYPAKEVELVGAAMTHLRDGGFEHGCRSYPLRAKDGQYRFASTSSNLPAPTLVLSFVDGSAADAIIRRVEASSGELTRLKKCQIPVDCDV